MIRDIEPAEPLHDRPMPDAEADMPPRILLVDRGDVIPAGFMRAFGLAEPMTCMPGDVLGVDYSAGDDLTTIFRFNAEGLLMEMQPAEPRPAVEIKANYSRRLDPMQQTLAMVSGITPQEITQASWRAPKKARKADAKAKAKRKQAKASRARNRR